MKLSEIIVTERLRRLNPHLFETRSAERGTRNGVSSEACLHEAVFDECRRRGWIALHGSMAERTCRTLGEPDFVILADGGRVLFVECKSRTGKLSVEQAALKHHAEKLGHEVHVVRSMAEFLAVVDRKVDGDCELMVDRKKTGGRP
jgi:Holliday junction resolvase-like predicted endonuclease